MGDVKYDPVRLLKLLLNAGVPVVGAAEDGRIDFLPEATDAQKATAEQIILDYSNETLPEELDVQVANQAITNFRSLPSWSTWTPQEGKTYVTANVLNGWDKAASDAWVDANVTSLATAKTAIKLLAGELITLRNIVSNIAMAVLFLRNISVRTVLQIRSQNVSSRG